MSRKQNKNSLSYSISQNFLTNRKLIKQLIKKTGINRQDTVLEIGAGKGHITKELSSFCKMVISYEIDKELYEKLKPQLGENVQLYHLDFLKCTLPKQSYKVFSNIPFSKTTAIMDKLTRAKYLPESLWLVMERGAAMRFCGLPKNSLHSLLIKPFFVARIIYTFRREVFHPAPHVDVVLLELKRKEKPDIQLDQRADYSTFLSHSLRFGLYGPRALLTKKQISMALRLSGLPPIRPSGEVLYIQWLCLFRCWLRYGKEN